MYVDEAIYIIDYERKISAIMGKGRAPCCDKSKVKRGPWSPEEDHKLITFIHKHGHENWRALPKLAGLVRCGKSCRLRWINYLRPDVNRGNFTKEEEETIIRLHEALGNKWSKIASHFPGRTDNEIKNVWNTHLKKRLKPKSSTSGIAYESSITTLSSDSFSSEKIEQDSEKQVSNKPINGIITEYPKESPASFSSTDNSNISKPEQQSMDPLFENLREDDDLLLEIPMDSSDYYIWDILDNPESFQSNDVQTSDNLRQQMNVAEDSEERKWFYELENELRLGATEELIQDKFLPKNDDADMAFLESSWPSWPEISGF